MKFTARTDANQKDIVAALRKIGAFVHIASGAGGGFPDLAVAFRGKWFLLEVKDAAKPPSAQALTPAQKVWHEAATKHAKVHVVNSVEQALQTLEDPA